MYLVFFFTKFCYLKCLYNSDFKCLNAQRERCLRIGLKSEMISQKFPFSYENIKLIGYFQHLFQNITKRSFEFLLNKNKRQIFFIFICSCIYCSPVKGLKLDIIFIKCRSRKNRKHFIWKG